MASTDLTLVPQSDGYLYGLGPPTDDAQTRVANRFIEQFLSAYNAETQRGAVFIDSLAAGNVRTNADIVAIVATAAAQVRALERELAYDSTLQSVEIVSITFVDTRTLKVVVRLNSTEDTSVNAILVTT